MVTTASIVASCGWIIPEPFAIPPTVKPSSETAASFVRVSVVRIASAASAPPSGDRAGTAVAQAGEHLVERQQHADHAGREDEHLLRVEVEQPARLGRGRERVELAALAGGRVRDARVDHDRLRLGDLEMLLRDDDRRGQHLVDGEHRRADRRHGRADDGEIEPLAPDARGDAGGDEALGRGDAHTSTPASRSPAVSGRPSARFAFCTACPAAPLPRLSIAQTTIRVPVARSVKTPSSAPSVP